MSIRSVIPIVTGSMAHEMSIFVLITLVCGCPSLPIHCQGITDNYQRATATKADEPQKPAEGTETAGEETDPRQNGESKATEPEPVETPLPGLSETAEGCVRFDTPIVEFTIRTDGKTEGHRFLQATGCRRADKLLMEHFKRWIFKPATENGQPIAKEYVIAIHW